MEASIGLYAIAIYSVTQLVCVIVFNFVIGKIYERKYKKFIENNKK